MGCLGYGGSGQGSDGRHALYLASLTKPLTAEILLRLVSADKLSLDEPVDRYWSDPDLANDPRRRRLTVRIARSHRTGFPNRRDTTGLTLDHDPGTTTGYSGEDYQYAARYPERRTGQPFEALAARWLFAPPGAFTFAALDRTSGDGIVILTNSDNGWRVVLPILERTGSDPKLIAFLRGQMG